jgi:hypothetical protein
MRGLKKMRTLKGQTVVRDESNPSDYPFDRILNAIPGVSAGTPGEEKTFGDILQGIYEVLRRAGITPDETPEKKDSSQFADAVEFLKPVAILKLGGGGIGEVAVLNANAREGYTFEYVVSSYSDVTYTASNKLTIKKDGVVSTENFIVQVSPCLATGGAGINIVAAKHGAGDSAAYFTNDDENIIINVASDSQAVAERTNLIATIYKI